MKNSHANAATIAKVDQIRATQDAQLDVLIEGFKRHAANHDGDPSCPFASTWMIAETVMPQRDVAGLLAAAVARLATPTPDMPS